MAWHYSIRTKVILGMGLPILFAYLSVHGFEYYLGKMEVFEDLEVRLAAIVDKHVADLEKHLSAIEVFGQSTARFINHFPKFSTEQIGPFIQSSLSNSIDISGVWIVFESKTFSGKTDANAHHYYRHANDTILFRNLAEISGTYPSLDWYRKVKQNGKPVWYGPYLDTNKSQEWKLLFCVSLYQENQFRGVVVVEILLEKLRQIVNQTTMGKKYVSLINQQSLIIINPRRGLEMNEKVLDLAERFEMDSLRDIGKRMIAGETGSRRVPDFETEETKWIVFAPVPTLNWSLAVNFPEEEVLAPFQSRFFWHLTIELTGLAIMTAIVFFAASNLTRPLSRLTSTVQSLGKGDFGVRVQDLFRKDEIGQLARTFNSMVADLQTNVEARIREETARKEVERELHFARTVQTTLFPNLASLDQGRDFSLHAMNLPAKQIAGDFFDFFYIDKHRLAITMADVSGKGIPAAIYMAVCRTMIRDLARHDRSPCEIITDLNRRLSQDNEQNMFVTVCFGFFNIHTGEFVYVNAGHNPPYHILQSGNIISLPPSGPLVAIFPEATYHEHRIQLGQNDLLVLFTDGITEALSPQNSYFGEECFEKLLSTHSHDSVIILCKLIMDTITEFSKGDLQDDITILALRRE